MLPHNTLSPILPHPLHLRVRLNPTILPDQHHAPVFELLTRARPKMSLAAVLQRHHPRPNEKNRLFKCESRPWPKLAGNVRRHAAGLAVHERHPRVRTGESVEGQRRHGDGVVGGGAEGVSGFQREVGHVQRGFEAGAQDGEDAREWLGGFGGGFVQEGEEVLCEAEARVVVQGELLVKAFACFCGVLERL